jgi:hypothetical protein
MVFVRRRRLLMVVKREEERVVALESWLRLRMNNYRKEIY